MRAILTSTVLSVAFLAAGCEEPKSSTERRAAADDKKEAKVNKEDLKLPDVNAKEWKDIKDGGLKGWDVKEGDGQAVPAGSTVTIHYTGWLKDGTVFDSSRTSGSKATFPLGRLIKGWQEGIPGMKVGGVRRLQIPWSMAYGPDGGNGIPPKADLVFEIELFGFEKPEVKANEADLKLPDLNAKEWKEIKDGLKAWDVTEGKGDAVKAGATVKVHYTGWTKDGKIFDSSRLRGEKIEFPLGGVIAGWTEGIPGMKVGGVRRLYIPWKMAYGERGRGDKIPPMADLIFDIELFETR